MRLNNKGQGQVLLIVLVVGIVFGGFSGNILSKLNPFKAKPGIMQKEQGNKEEYFRDKIKGIEYRSKETHKYQNRENSGNATVGQKVGNFIDSSIQFIIFFIIGGLALLYFTGFNIFKRFRNLLKDLKAHKRALKQTVKAVDIAKPKLNGEDRVLKEELAKAQDEATKILINKMKNE